MTKMSIDDKFFEEAKAFVPSTKPEKVYCNATTKKGDRCKNAAKCGDFFCGRHTRRELDDLANDIVDRVLEDLEFDPEDE